jgi:hypothetical protein
MGKTLIKGFFCLLLMACALAGCQAKVTPADLVLRNGRLYTVDDAAPWAEAAAVRNGRLVYVGDEAGAARYIGGATRVIDLGGRLALPGFVDSHAHPISSYKHFFEIDLNGCRGGMECQRRVADYARSHPGAAFFRGRGWSNTDFPRTGPDKRLLDAVVPRRPVSLSSEDGHSKWVNSRALELAGITRSTPDPAGGVIERDPRSGEPSGTLREAAADLVAGLFPAPGPEELKKGLEAYQEMALACGITTVHDASLDAESSETQAYRELEGTGRLRLRVRASLYVDPLKGIAQLAALDHERLRNAGSRFRTRTAKLFADGVVEGSTAFLLEPYRHLPGSRGEPIWDADALARMCRELDRRLWQVHIHAIGDAAVRSCLDAFAFARQENGQRDSRHLLTHLQLVEAGDIARFAPLGVVAVVQPFWFTKDAYYRDIQVPYLGRERADLEYPMAGFLRAGVAVASSSDFPVTVPCDPLRGIQTGVTRTEIGKTGAGEVLWPGERVSLEQMIASFTRGGAYANFLEDVTGSLATGKSADLIVLDKDLFKIPATDIASAKVLMTLLEGEVVYGGIPGN